MKLSILAAYLVAIGVASANPLLARQAATTSSSSLSSSDTLTATISSSSSTSATSSLTTTTTTSATDSSSSSSSSSTSSTSESTPTSTTTPAGVSTCTQEQAVQLFDSGKYKGDPALCGFTGNNNTIVIPANGPISTYITWWPGAFNITGAKVTVHLDWMDGSGKHIWSYTTDAFMGFAEIIITQDFLNGASSSYYRMILNETDPRPGMLNTEGPVVNFFAEDTTPKPPPPTSFNFLGVAIGVPIALAVIVAVLGVFCCVTNRHKSFFAKIKLPTSRRGYGVRQSRRQRVGPVTDDYDFDASAPIYRDDPGADYSSSTREERSARAMGVFSAEQNLHSTY